MRNRGPILLRTDNFASPVGGPPAALRHQKRRCRWTCPACTRSGRNASTAVTNHRFRVSVRACTVVMSAGTGETHWCSKAHHCRARSTFGVTNVTSETVIPAPSTAAGFKESRRTQSENLSACPISADTPDENAVPRVSRGQSPEIRMRVVVEETSRVSPVRTT